MVILLHLPYRIWHFFSQLFLVSEPSKEQSLVGNESLDVLCPIWMIRLLHLITLEIVQNANKTFHCCLGAIVLDNVSGTFDIWNKFYANSTSGPG
ncbi:hypothetical protein WN943_022939 [Citrus x changshan-huyou]